MHLEARKPEGHNNKSIEIRCISTFSKVDKIKHITLARDHLVKFILGDRVLICNDIGKPQFVDRINFVRTDWVDEIFNV